MLNELLGERVNDGANLFNEYFLFSPDYLKVQPVRAFQSTQHKNRHASFAIDGKMNTPWPSHTVCQKDTTVWFEMVFRTEVCFKEVKVHITHRGPHKSARTRMDKTEIFVGNKNRSKCGQMDVTDPDKDIYTIPCDNACGDIIRLEVNHKTGDYQNLDGACIHMFEIEAYTESECPAGYFLKENVCEPCSEGEYSAGGK